MEGSVMDWKEATDLGQDAARLIDQITLLFEEISEGGYVVVPPSWRRVEESQVRPGSTKALVTLELDDHLQIAKVVDPVPVDGPLAKAPPSHGPLPHKDQIPRWSARLDEQTCDACRCRHGMTRTESEVHAVRCTNPNGCRCLVIDPTAHPPRANSNKAGG